MRIWLLGTEGRMPALARHLKRFGHKVFFSGPGCPGTERHAQRIELDLKNPDFDTARALARANAIELLVPGSEDLLDQGVVDELQQVCRVFGPTKKAARLETDKRFSYQLMLATQIPQAATAWYDNYNEALSDALNHFKIKNEPLVVKPSGRTGGKGVTVAWNVKTAQTALYELMNDRKYGAAADFVGLAEYLKGPECSVFVACNGQPETARFIAVARDCKPLFPARNGNPPGPNTGGVWSVSGIPEWTLNLEQEVMTRCVWAILQKMTEEGNPFTGLLYVALKLTSTGPKVVEYNGRFGDPEAQAVLERLESNLAPILWACTEPNRKLQEVPIVVSSRVGGCLVITAPGYPEKPITGKRITGINNAEATGVNVEHCGTALNEHGELVTAGGRALNLNSSADTLEELRAKLNRAASLIHFEGGEHWRDDLGDPSAAS